MHSHRSPRFRGHHRQGTPVSLPSRQGGQIQHPQQGRADHHRGIPRPHNLVLRRAGGITVAPHLHARILVHGHPGNPPQPRCLRQMDAVPRLQSQGRQRPRPQGQRLNLVLVDQPSGRGPCQPRAADGGQVQIHAAAVTHRPHRHRSGLIVIIGMDEAHPRHARSWLQIPAFGPACPVISQRQFRGLQRQGDLRHAQDCDPPAPLGADQVERGQQRLQRVPGPHRPVDDIARHRSRHRPDRDPVGAQPGPFQDGGQQVGRVAAHPPVQPVSGPPRRSVGPARLPRRKLGPRPRVPAPGIGRVQHRPAVHG